MKNILSFLLEHLELVIYISLFFVEILILIIKKPTKMDTTKEKILRLLPLFISYAENYFTESKAGSKKLEMVVRNVKQYLSLDDEYDSFIISEVERILSTPSKKMEKGE